MFAVVSALAVGVAAAAFVAWRAKRPLGRATAIALVGSYAGALAGAFAGDLLLAVNSLAWVEIGVVVGSISGALGSLSLDRRSARHEEEAAETNRSAA